MFRKVLVANRGEIAVRVMRACEELNISTVAVYSEADKDAGHVRYADEAYNIGPATASESYLDGGAVIDAARRADADAIHPGYGFLAENADFARQVEHADGITWIGPSSDAMETLGEKTSARTVMDAAGVPIVPGTTDPVTDSVAVEDFAETYGYPVAIKAEGGGGGRGMKVVREPADIEEQLEAAKREGEAYFDNDTVYLERYLENPRHVEVQILADEYGTVRHLGERDCSLQRRHQKVIEEAPSPALSDELRADIGEAARRGIAEAGYTNAGTVEFLVEGDDFYFLEVNTRIQVEHTITEELTGIDIVKWQIKVAAGEEITFSQSAVSLDGHAMEFRINAENAAEDFAPASGGTLSTYDPPGGIGVRVDDAIRQGDALVTDYDSMIAKLIVTGSTRDECIARSLRALREYDIEGVTTIIPFHRLMLTDEQFNEGTHTTKYLDEEVDPERIADAHAQWGSKTADTAASDDSDQITREFTVEVNGKRFDVALETDDTPQITTDEPAGPTETRPETATTDSTGAMAGETVTADMQGTILETRVTPGDEVTAGDVVCVLEAMKMENDIVADVGGEVTDVPVDDGDSVDAGDTLVVLE